MDEKAKIEELERKLEISEAFLEEAKSRQSDLTPNGLLKYLEVMEEFSVFELKIGDNIIKRSPEKRRSFSTIDKPQKESSKQDDLGFRLPAMN